jgi:hypothetical protein
LPHNVPFTPTHPDGEDKEFRRGRRAFEATKVVWTERGSRLALPRRATLGLEI